jgi:cell division protein FtsI/penicillin-binding protein 2
MKYEKLLAAKNGFKTTLKDARRRPISVAADDYLPPQNGQHLMLTIDSNIQMIAEQELAAACTEFNAKRGEVVVMDPKSGDVLALATGRRSTRRTWKIRRRNSPQSRADRSV